MNGVTEHPVSCPCCGEIITVLIDGSLPVQEYVEDCQVCCRPIALRVTVDVCGEVAVRAMNENA